VLALFNEVGTENFQPLRFSMVKFAIGGVDRIVFYLFGGRGVLHLSPPPLAGRKQPNRNTNYLAKPTCLQQFRLDISNPTIYKPNPFGFLLPKTIFNFFQK